MDLVGVPSELINQHGAVSEAVAQSMAVGGLKSALADIVVSVTGIAGPQGGTADKPVGMVCFGLATKRDSKALTVKFPNTGRHHIREQSVKHALKLLLEAAQAV